MRLSMNPLLLVIVSIVVLALGYLLYGRWLARRWGIDPSREAPALEREDGIEYAPAPPYVVFNHQFSSIASAGAVSGPIQAAIFGWLPVVLWVLIGGIFIGAAQDFGSLFVSLRNKGRMLVVTVQENIDDMTKRLYCVFAFVVLVLVIAAFSSIVATTFQVLPTQSEALNHANAQVALISALFVVAAIVWGVATRGRNIPTAASVCIAIVVVVVIVVAGMLVPDVLRFDGATWMLAIGVYILLAAIAPVWILLQPRDYLSGFLLFGMIGLALVGIIGSGIAGTVGQLDIPLFSGFVATSDAFDAQTGQILLDSAGQTTPNPVAQGGFLFPALFVTITCGAVSGFHSLVSSGTASKQLESESYALPVGFGGMLLVCLVSIVALCAVGFAWDAYAAGEYSSPAQVFADGISGMLALVPGLQGTKDVAYSLLALCVSVLCLTTLDTATRLARYAFQELWVPAGMTIDELTGFRKVLANKFVATAVAVVLGLLLGMTGYAAVWPLFGAANLLLAALALLAISAWLGNAGKSYSMLRLPRAITLIIAICSLLLTIFQKVVGLMLGNGDIIVNVVQLVVALALLVVGIIVAAKGRKVVLTNPADVPQDAL